MPKVTLKQCAFVIVLSTTVGLAGALCQAHAQSTFADKMVMRLVGRWVQGTGRAIQFEIRDGNPLFQDEIEPSVTLTGAYRQDDSGADYVLRYTQGFGCRYNLNVIGSEGDEINLRLVSAIIPKGTRFRCIEGTLKRARAN
jgi:hypothetical protein